MKKVLSILLALLILLSAVTVAMPVTSSAKKVKCRGCDGLGRIDCPMCKGWGYYDCPYCHGIGGYWTPTAIYTHCTRCFYGRVDCPKCNHIGYFKCTGCDGKGYYEDYSDSSSGSGSSSSSGSSSNSGSSSGSGTQTTVAKPPKTSISRIIAREAAFSVSWKAQTNNTTGYQIQYAANSKFTGGKAKAIKGKTNTTVTGLTGGKRYYVRVRTYRTYSGKNYYSAWSAAKSFVTKKVAKPAATSISKIVSKQGGFSVSWAKRAKNLTGYQIQYATNSKFKSGKAKAVKGKTSTTVTGLTGNKRYYVRVRTYRTLNGKNYFSAWSSAKSIVTKKASTPAKPPKSTKILKLYDAFAWAGDVEIYFAHVKDCTGYQLQLSQYSDFRSDTYTKLYTSPRNNHDRFETTESNPWEWVFGYYTRNTDYLADIYYYEFVDKVDNRFSYSIKGEGTYYFRMRAFNSVDGKNYYSAWSNVVSAEINK